MQQDLQNHFSASYKIYAKTPVDASLVKQHRTNCLAGGSGPHEDKKSKQGGEEKQTPLCWLLLLVVLGQAQGTRDLVQKATHAFR